MKTHTRTTFLMILALLVAGFFAISPGAAVAATPPEDSEEVTKLLSSAKMEAHELERDAEELQTSTRQKLSWQSQAARVNAIAEHVNNTGRLLAELNAARETASPWQQAAIDGIEPLLRELADNTESTIERLNNSPNRLKAAETYKEYAAANFDLAKELTALIDDHMEYGMHKAEFDRLEEKLKIAER